LSGGEKNRLKLMTVLMKNPNFLILDEPTNDFDIYTMTVLEDYLTNYPGCLMIVSHDRYFMDKLVDHVFYFQGDGKIKDISGNYTAYHRERMQMQQEMQKAAANPVKKETIDETDRNPSRAKKLSFKEKLEFDNLESEIAELEAKKEELTEKLSDSNLTGEELNVVSMNLTKIMTQIEQKTDRWLELADV
jgi:ATP-binding cassette subfamily F protein uup